MRIWHITAAALVTFGLGCNKSPEGGTPGTDASFKLSLPTSKDVKQGDTESFDASITRGSAFKKDVTLKAEAPDKLGVKLSKGEIKSSEADLKFTITVTPAVDAPIGEHKVTITGTPADGKPTSEFFTVKVTAK